MKYFIFRNILIFNFIVLIFNDLLIIWFFIEISNFLFISFLRINLKNKKIIFFYYLIQLIASFIILFSIIINFFLIFNIYSILIISSLIIKLRIPPFHFWLPLIAKYLPWNILLIIITIQKIIPFYIISFIIINKILFYLIIILSSIIPPFIIFSITNFKTLIRYSSINHSSWIILLIYIKSFIWIKYFILYSFINISRLIIFNLFNINININYNLFNHWKFNLLIITIIFTIAGLPPFSLFYIKWYRIFFSIINTNLFILLIILILRSLFILYIYTNIIIISLFFYKFNSKIIKYNIINFYDIYTIFFFLRLFLTPLILFI